MAKEFKRCTRCLLDTTVPEIVFDDKGVCQYCKIHDIQEKKYPLGAESKANLDQVIERIKAKGKGRQYDCIIGDSGGAV